MALGSWLMSRRDALWLRACTSVGQGAALRGRPYVQNDGRIHLGARFRLSSQPVMSHLLTGSGGVLEIGDDVVIGYGAAISCFSRMRIGNGTHLGPFAVVSDSDFHVVGDRDAAPVPRAVDIGSGVRVGARVTILPGSRIGDGAVVAAGSTVAGTIAPGAIVAGVPARAVRDTSAMNAAAAGGSWEDAVRALVQRTLGLSTLPLLEQGPGELPQWDSLGALRLLLGLEEELGIRLTEKEMVGVKRVADLVTFASERANAAGPTQ
jgi:acetyltransferase-like isoleucine patch superfamily enzyme/acyl carrier protein